MRLFVWMDFGLCCAHFGALRVVCCARVVRFHHLLLYLPTYPGYARNHPLLLPRFLRWMETFVWVVGGTFIYLCTPFYPHTLPIHTPRAYVHS